MYQVSNLEMISASRCLVHLEEDISFPLYRKELGVYGISEGADLSEQNYQEIMTELLPKRACHRAMYLLQKMDRTEFQLRKKLTDSFYPEEIVDFAVDYVKKFHYIDDVRYAWNYIDFRKADHSRMQLWMELQSKGVSQADIETAMEQTEFTDETEQILYWMEKKHFSQETADWKEQQKFCQFLMRKGFSASAIRTAMRGVE